MSIRLLVVEDDKDLQSVLTDFLQDEGFVTDIASTGSEALAKLDRALPDLVLLDLGLPDIQGETVLEKIRDNYPDLPVVILTAKSKPKEIAAGLNLGADDYLPKPFAAEELLARIKKRLKNTDNQTDTLMIDDLILDMKKLQAKRKDKAIELTRTEFQLLKLLMKNKGIVLTRESILNNIWGFTTDVESRVVDVYIGYLRKKIDNGNKKKLIKNKRGFGYLIDD